MLGFKTIEEFTLVECDDFLQREDISDDARQRAIRRKNELIVCEDSEPPVDKPQTVMERFPDIRFVYNRKVVPNYLIVGFLWLVVILEIIIMNLYEYGTLNVPILCLCGLLLVVMVKIYYKRHMQLKNLFIEETKNRFILVSDLYKVGLCYKNTLRILVPIEYDSVVKNGSDYFVVEKDGKKGVYKRKKIIIPIEYNDIQWNSNNNVFYAEKNGRQIIIDINGNEVG